MFLNLLLNSEVVNLQSFLFVINKIVFVYCVFVYFVNVFSCDTFVLPPNTILLFASIQASSSVFFDTNSLGHKIYFRFVEMSKQRSHNSSEASSLLNKFSQGLQHIHSRSCWYTVCKSDSQLREAFHQDPPHVRWQMYSLLAVCHLLQIHSFTEEQKVYICPLIEDLLVKGTRGCWLKLVRKVSNSLFQLIVVVHKLKVPFTHDATA